MTQFLGYERAFLELCDRPDEAHAFFRKVMEMEICFTERQFEAIGPVEGGWVCERFDWCPAQCIGFNLDDFILCANEMFLEFGLPYYQAMADRFGYGVLHYHTPDMRLMKAAARMKNVAVQVGVDPKLPLPWQRLDEIKAACGDMPITWMRIPRDEFLRRLKEGRLPGNVEYCISDAIDLDDARRLAEMGRSYQAR